MGFDGLCKLRKRFFLTGVLKCFMFPSLANEHNQEPTDWLVSWPDLAQLPVALIGTMASPIKKTQYKSISSNIYQDIKFNQYIHRFCVFKKILLCTITEHQDGALALPGRLRALLGFGPRLRSVGTGWGEPREVDQTETGAFQKVPPWFVNQCCFILLMFYDILFNKLAWWCLTLSPQS